jgi:hypothetical protein
MSRGRGKNNIANSLGRPRKITNLHLSKTIKTKAAFCKKYDYLQRWDMVAGLLEIEDPKWIDYLVKDPSNAVRRILAKKHKLTPQQFQTLWADQQKGIKAAEGLNIELIHNPHVPSNIIAEISEDLLNKGVLPAQIIRKFSGDKLYNHTWGHVLSHPNLPLSVIEKIHSIPNMPLQSAAYEIRKELYTVKLLEKVAHNLEHISMNALVELVQDQRISDKVWTEVLDNKDLPIYQRNTITDARFSA